MHTELIARLRRPLYWWCGSGPDDERVDIAPVVAADVLETVWLHVASNASMRPEKLESISHEAAIALLIGIARDAQAITGLSAEQAEAAIVEATQPN